MIKQYLIENPGYPVSFFLDLFVNLADQGSDIEQIDMYADADRKILLAEDMSLTEFPAATQMNIQHAFHNALCKEMDAKAFARKVERAQASLRDQVGS